MSALRFWVMESSTPARDMRKKSRRATVLKQNFGVRAGGWDKSVMISREAPGAVAAGEAGGPCDRDQSSSARVPVWTVMVCSIDWI